MTPVLAVAVLAVVLLALLARRRGAADLEVLAITAFGFVSAVIAVNKVGSPQFVTWLAVPVILGLSTAATGRGASFRFPAALSLVIALLTQVIYPSFYQQLLALNVWMLLILSARNLLYLVLLAWAVWSLVRLLDSGVDLQLVDESNWLPRVWPFAPERGGDTGQGDTGQEGAKPFSPRSES